MYNIKEQQAHEEFLAEMGTVEIYGIEFDKAAILKEMDPIAYNEAFSNFCDAMGFDFNEEEEDEEYDGQPDEAQEWESFDADC
jgi:hypothetical protein